MYHQDQIGVHVASANALVSTAGAVFWAPGYAPFHLQAIALTVSTGVTTNPGVVTVNHRPTAGSASGESVVDTITVPVVATAPLGTVIFVDGLDVIIQPGGEIEFDGGGEGDAGAVHIAIFGHWLPPDPENNSDMVRSA